MGGGRGPGLRRPPADGDGWFCLGLPPPSAVGLAWRAPLSRPLRPPTFLETGGLAVPPAGAAPPAPCLGNGGFVVACALLQQGGWFGGRRYPARTALQRYWKQGDSLYPRRGLRPLQPAWRTGGLLWLAPSFSGGVGLACAVVPPAHPPTLLETGGLAVPPAGAAPPAPCLGNGGVVVACALLQRWGWLGGRRCPTGPPSSVIGNRGTRCTPGGGCAPCTLLRERGGCRGLRPPSAVGLVWRAPLSHLAHPPTFLETGGLPLYQRPCTLLGNGDRDAS